MSDTASRFEPHPDDPAPRAGRNNPSLSPQPRRAPKRERSPQARTAFLADNGSGLLAVRDLRPHGRGDYRDPRFLAPPDLCRDELRGEDGPPIFQLGGEIEASVFALVRGPWPAPVERWPDWRPSERRRDFATAARRIGSDQDDQNPIVPADQEICAATAEPADQN